ncbi:DUF6766 family protein, partial [Candidatus Binatus sp.]|uniref:DUF6766 family protein n=1 Tax=Candidatus Binatus sp. TaxID=2811406 RepID=UPI003C560898
MDYNNFLARAPTVAIPVLRGNGGGRNCRSDHLGPKTARVVNRPSRKLVQPSGNSRVHRERRPPIRRLIHTVTENSLSIVLFSLFVICISGDSVAGWHLQNEMLAAHGRASVAYGHFLFTGAFLEGLASNWQAAVLQLGSLVL